MVAGELVRVLWSAGFKRSALCFWQEWQSSRCSFLLPFHPQKRPEGSVCFWGWNESRKITSLPGTLWLQRFQLPASQPLLYIWWRLGNREKLATLGIIKCYLLSGVWTPASNNAADLSLFTPQFRELSRHGFSYLSDGLCSTTIMPSRMFHL